MKKTILLFLLFAVTFSYAQELLLVDLTTTNQVTFTATTNASAATVSGSDGTGIYFENFFVNDPTNEVIANSLVSGDLTTFNEATDNSPSLYRGGNSGGGDPGLNIYSFATASTVNFTAGTQAFTGSGTWTLDAADYAAFLTAPASGNLYFPADTVDDLSGATLIGTYTVVGSTFSVADNVEVNKALLLYPNPTTDFLSISGLTLEENYNIYNILGKVVASGTIANQQQIDVSNLTNGMYFIKLESGKELKFIKE